MGILRVGGALGRGYFNAARSANNSLTQASAGWAANRGSKAVREGRIGPLDPTPPAGAEDYQDFRGAALPADIKGAGSDFPLGSYILPKSPWRASQSLALTARAVNAHTTVLAPSTIGKTTSIIAPWIHSALQAGYLVVAVDVKGNGDLHNKVKQYGAANGGGAKFGATAFDYENPAKSLSWNFIDDLRTESAINSVAEGICGAPRDNDPNMNFHIRDLNWMRGLLELAHDSRQQFTVRSLLMLLKDQQAFEDLVDSQHGSRASDRLSDLCGLTTDDFNRSRTFLSSYLEKLNAPGFNAITTHPGLSLHGRDLDQPCLMVVNAPMANETLSAAVAGLFITQIVNQRLAAGGGAVPMLLVIDEAPKMQKILPLGRWTSLVASSGISMLLAAQDVKQFHEDTRDEILDNCATIIALANAPASTTEYIAKRLGTRVRATQQKSQNYDQRNGRSTNFTKGSETVPVIGHDEITNPPAGEFGATVISRSLSRKPILVDLYRPDAPPRQQP
jgi:hypothetical protein